MRNGDALCPYLREHSNDNALDGYKVYQDTSELRNRSLLIYIACLTSLFILFKLYHGGQYFHGGLSTSASQHIPHITTIKARISDA